MKQLRRSYPQFTVWERVQLFLAARERGDLSELYTLDDACPDSELLEYTIHLDALGRAASLFVVRLLANALFLHACLAGTPSTAPADLAADAPLASLLQRQAALWRAFVAYCQHHGHDPHQVLNLAPLGLDDGEPVNFIVHQQLQLLEALPDDLLHDPDQFQAWRNLFRRAFPPHPPF